MAWCFEDQRTGYTTAVLEALVDGYAVVPALWFLEVANVATLTEQKGVLRAADRVRFLKLLGGLRKQVDHATGERVWGEVYTLSLRHQLTSYDARYLELAKRMSLPLASQDGDLRAAAKKEGVALFSGRR
jgi:predicted nucleic acid-binding protein